VCGDDRYLVAALRQFLGKRLDVQLHAADERLKKVGDLENA
jgi:hypothetical protein